MIQILHIEDSAGDALLLDLELRRAGLSYTLKRIETREALSRELEAVTPDILITDFQLPQMNALEVLALVKGRGGAFPVIVFSGTFRDGDEARCAAAGARACLVKEDLPRLPELIAESLR